MNFDHMPELHWRVGYPFAVASMVAAGLTLHRVFHRVSCLNPTSLSGSGVTSCYADSRPWVDGVLRVGEYVENRGPGGSRIALCARASISTRISRGDAARSSG